MNVSHIKRSACVCVYACVRSRIRKKSVPSLNYLRDTLWRVSTRSTRGSLIAYNALGYLIIFPANWIKIQQNRSHTHQQKSNDVIRGAGQMATAQDVAQSPPLYVNDTDTQAMACGVIGIQLSVLAQVITIKRRSGRMRWWPHIAGIPTRAPRPHPHLHVLHLIVCGRIVCHDHLRVHITVHAVHGVAINFIARSCTHADNHGRKHARTHARDSEQ